MWCKIQIRKGIYNLADQMAKSTIVDVFQGPYIFRTTIYRVVEEYHV